MNIKTKAIILSSILFLMINTTVYILTQVYSEDKIDIILKNNLNTLQTHYETLLHTQKLIASTIFQSTIKKERIIEIIAQANTATKEKKKRLRDELHELLKEKYILIKKLGVLQHQFVLSTNESFYRAHKPERFGDDLTDIRADFQYVNETQKVVRDFVQGRVAHGFRNTFPLFDKNNKHIGAMEVSFSSDSFQWYLNNISKIHTHFLVNKNIFDAKTWKRDDLVLNYEQSAESLGYMIALNRTGVKDEYLNNTRSRLANKKEEINSNMNLNQTFSIYLKYSNYIEAVSFFPVKNMTHNTVAWIISYKKSPMIEAVLFNKLVIRIVSLLISLLIIYLILKNIHLKQEREASLKYQRLLELSRSKSSLAFWEYDYKKKIFLVNDLYYQFLATTAQKEGGYEISIEKYFEEFLTLESQKIILKHVEEVNSKNSDYPYKFEYTMRRRDGVVIPVIVDGYATYDKYGKPDKAYGTKYNILKQKKKESELINEKDKVKKLLEQQKTLTSIFDKGDSILFKWQNNKQLSVDYISNSISKLLGYSTEELLTKEMGYTNLVHKDDMSNLLREIINCVKNKENFIKHKPYRLVTKNNTTKWVMQYTATQKDEYGEIIHFISYLNNITDSKLFEKKIENYLELIDKNIISSSTDLEGTIIDVSTAFTELTGYSKDELTGCSHRILKDFQTPIEDYKTLWNTITNDKIWSGEVKNFKKDKSTYWINAKIFPIFDDNEIKTGYIAIRQDITDKKRLEQISIIDELTGLYNRRHFNKVIKDEINRAKREDKLISFLMLDIDHFKQYNDTYGHQEGDVVIREISQVIKEFASRAGDHAFRLGGEEFGVIFTDIDKQKMKKYASTLIETIENLKIQHENNSASEYVTISAGLAFSNEDNLNSDALYKYADDLLYKAKDNGRNRLEFDLL